MYHPHFGLAKSLFHEGIALDAAVYLSPQYNRLIASFKVALTSPSSVIVLTGPAGVGKTTLTSTALRATTTRLAIAWLNGTPTNASELLELLLIELGIATLRTTRLERLQLWRQFQSEMSTTASRLFVVAERTEDLSAEVLRALDSLTSPDAAGNTGANVVLLGQPGLERHLAASSLDALRQRVRLKAQLDPFTEAELQDYLRHQVACAGGRFDSVFAPGVVAALYRHSGGVARLANNLCETALTLAATELEKTLTLATLTKAAAMLGLADATPPATVSSAPAKPAAATPTPERIEPARRVEPSVITPPPTPARAEAKPVARAPAASPAPTVPAFATAPPTAAPTVARTLSTPLAVPAGTPAAPAAVATAPPAPATPPPARAPVAAFDLDLDGGATDLPDIPSSELPVLTDAVEMPAPAPRQASAAPPAAAKPAPAPPPAAALKPTSAAAAPRPTATASTSSAAIPPPAKRPETAYSAPKPGAPAKPAVAASAPSPAAPPAPAAVAPPAPVATPAAPAATSTPPKPAESDDEDLLRQTQTMRAIAVAKSIDDLDDSMAETLFGDAELDLMTAALASSANWEDDTPGIEPSKPEANAPPPKPATAPARPTPAAKAAAAAPPKPKPAESDDLLDLLGLSDAPLELIDDSTLPPTAPSHKTAARR